MFKSFILDAQGPIVLSQNLSLIRKSRVEVHGNYNSFIISWLLNFLQQGIFKKQLKFAMKSQKQMNLSYLLNPQSFYLIFNILCNGYNCYMLQPDVNLITVFCIDISMTGVKYINIYYKISCPMRFQAIHIFYVMVRGPLCSTYGNRNISAVFQ